ncbi:hypothetical protein [Tepidimicrobium xylanilyticum]|uniref:hypothetical protein n=1 Tax=Tepidimicrobium xylanilyticum TaxID=1123352 RepID=UPI000B832616|nr:hypothetical protein [Tepidimicrobium xylanilyticum]
MQEDYDYDTLISKQIAKELGLSRDSVRGYCKRNGLDGYGTEKSSLVWDIEIRPHCPIYL